MAPARDDRTGDSYGESVGEEAGFRDAGPEFESFAGLDFEEILKGGTDQRPFEVIVPTRDGPYFLGLTAGLSPQGHSVVFVSTDAQGGAGPLLSSVRRDLGGWDRAPDAGLLRNGYWIAPQEAAIVVFVVTVGLGGGAELLKPNLDRAIAELVRDGTLRDRALGPGASWWMPLMGTGSGGLTPTDAAALTGEVLALHHRDIGMASVTVSLADGASREAFEDAASALRRGVGAELAEKGLDPEPLSGPELIAAIQQAVSDLPEPKGSVAADGIAGPQLQSAVGAAMAALGLDWDGEYDRDLLVTLQTAARRHEQAYFHADRPVEGIAADALDRESVARAIAENVRHVWADHRTNNWPFIVHLAGEWGSGKSSVLRFLRDVLTADESQTPNPQRHGAGHRGWVVAEFNAWRMQGQGAAWWSLLNVLLTDAVAQSDPWEGRRLKWWDARWRFLTGWRPWIIGGLVVATVVLGGLAVSGGGEGGPFASLLTLSPFLTAALALVGFVTTFTARSKRTAEAMLEMDLDPLRPLRARYAQMVREIKRPVAVFIDDLDRCDAKYVVEVLQALQTVYSEVPVLYVVAADGEWIVSAYEQQYAAFSASLSRPGQPLGHRFLNKIFQLSVGLPELSGANRERYLQLLVGAGEQDPQTDAGAEALAAVAAAAGPEEIARAVRAARDRPDGRAVARAGFEKLMDAKVQVQIRHRLLDYADLLEANPRAIKRLVNVYSFRLGYAFLGQLDVPPDVLVRWCILDLRFPRAAVALRERPELCDVAARRPEDAALFADPAVDGILEPLSAEDVALAAGLG